MSNYPTVISRGQVATLQATFTSEATGLPVDPTTVTLEVRTIDAGGRFVVTEYVRSGVDTPELLRVSEGVFRGLYTPDDDEETFSLKLFGAGAVVGASAETFFLVTP